MRTTHQDIFRIQRTGPGRVAPVVLERENCVTALQKNVKRIKAISRGSDVKGCATIVIAEVDVGAGSEP